VGHVEEEEPAPKRFKACPSPMIFFLIWLLSYEGSISNPFQVCRNIVAGVAFILVL